ncbi:hypothetical protein EYF80_005688 [Liparis tanakae]|uniref:Uncharacterized protein n=1 Tax=Liparis tanakae TaxID=230148 RepID=A0A4Z2J3Q0_9TELE|nr:hypothetical protein EYF80_005688 [Liparis tanakae]
MPDPGLSYHLQHTGLPSALIPNHNHLQPGERGTGVRRRSGARRRTGSRLWRWGTRRGARTIGCCGPPDLLLVLLDLLLNKNELAKQTLLGYVIMRDRKKKRNLKTEVGVYSSEDMPATSLDK